MTVIPSNMDSHRRVDTELRAAIDDIQAHLFDPGAQAKVEHTLLEKVVALSGASHGVVADIEKNSVYFFKNSDPSRGSSLNPEFYPGNAALNHNLVDCNALAQVVKRSELSFRPVIYNLSIPTEFDHLVFCRANANSMLVVPLLKGTSIVAVIFTFLDRGEFDLSLIKRLTFLTASASCALRSCERLSKFHFELEKEDVDSVFISNLVLSSPSAILTIDKDHKIVSSNPAADQLFEAINGGLKGIAIETLVPFYSALFQWSKQPSNKMLDQSLEGRGIEVSEEHIAKKINGDEFLARFSVFRYENKNGRYTVIQILDLGSSDRSIADYRHTVHQFQALTHLLPVGIIHVDSQWRCIYANDSWYRLSGLNSDETAGEGWVNAIDASDVSGVLQSLRTAMRSGQSFKGECRLYSPLGESKWVELSARSLFADNGKMLGFLATFTDITERLEAQQKLKQVAEFDSLTGLPNRNLFQDRLQHHFKVSSRDKSDISVLFLDLDGFKDVNDTFGHDKGDELLKMVAVRLNNTLRQSDTIARFGGDEFAVILEADLDRKHVESVAEKICLAFQRPFVICDQEVYVTTSVGIAIGNPKDSTPTQLMKQADIALYRAKHDGKSKYRHFSDELDEESRERIRTIQGLRDAMESNQFHLVYQLQADVKTQQCMGMEVLLRWRSDQLGDVPAYKFIPLLEEQNLIREVGAWVIDQAVYGFSSLRRHGRIGEQASLSINISPKQLGDNAVVNTVKESCAHYGVPLHCLVFEITESVLIQRPLQVRKVLEELRELGIQVALDDFGTGYSSLSYLQTFPIDHIKIDQSFVRDMLTDNNDAKITRAIVSLSKSLGLKVIAEGVESRESLKLLDEYGCDYFQGYFYAKPLPLEELLVGNQNQIARG